MIRFIGILLSLSIIPFSFLSANADVWGDADGDGVLTAADVALTLQNVLTNGSYIAAADVDGNGKLDSKDAAIILQKLLDSNYVMPVEETEAATEEITEATTEAPTEEITEATTEASTEVSTEASTEATTEEITEATTEEVTETTTVPADGVIYTDYELLPADLSTSPYITLSGDFSASSDERIRLTGENELSFKVAEGANLYVTAKHASTTTSGTRTVTLYNSSGSKVASKGYEMGVDPVEYLYAAGLSAGTYTLSSDNHINITSIRFTFEYIETTTEATTVRELPEVPSEITTTGNAVNVSNFSELSAAIGSTNTDIYVLNDIDCSAQIRLTGTDANVNIIGVTQADGTSPSLNFATFRDSATSTGSSYAGIRVNGSGYNFENIIVENAPDCGMRITGTGSGNCLIKDCIFRYNNNSGVSVTSGGADNTFICVDSYRNGDIVQKCGDDADGFSVKLSAGDNNYFYNCRAWENSDDGWDSYDRDTAVGDVYYIECLAWNNGNPNVFTGEYDYDNGFPLDKGLLYVQAILDEDPDFETKFNNRTVDTWPSVTIHLYGLTRTYDELTSTLWGGNPNGFKFGSAATPSTSYRYIENCIAFDHVDNLHQSPAKGYDQNSGYAQYDIINGLSFDNQQNYWMDKMTGLSQTGEAWSFGGGQSDTTNDSLTLTTPSADKQEELRAAVHQYRDELYDLVYNDIIPGEKLCDVFND